jgi:hypothetical protein
LSGDVVLISCGEVMKASKKVVVPVKAGTTTFLVLRNLSIENINIRRYFKTKLLPPVRVSPSKDARQQTTLSII